MPDLFFKLFMENSAVLYCSTLKFGVSLANSNYLWTSTKVKAYVLSLNNFLLFLFSAFMLEPPTSHYEYICPIDTSEGIIVGLIGSPIHVRIGSWGRCLYYNLYFVIEPPNMTTCINLKQWLIKKGIRADQYLLFTA